MFSGAPPEPPSNVAGRSKLVILGDRKGRVSAEQLENEMLTLERLLSDFRDLRRGGMPAQAILDAAPLLDTWSFATSPAPCLVGLSFGHPVLEGSARPICTSPLWILAPEAGWARTHSRYYRLGRPIGHVSHDQ